MPFRISLIAFDDCLASGVIGALDLLHAANAIAPRLQPDAPATFAVQILTPDGRPARAASGVTLTPDYALADATPAQAILVPGISLIEPTALLGTVERLAPLSHWLRAQHDAGAWLAASCSGTFLVAQAGLLDGHDAATTSWFAELFEQRYPTVHLDRAATLVTAPRIATAGGAFGYIDLSLFLIEALAGRELARACARFIVLDNRRGPQAPALIPHHMQAHDPLVTKVERWMRANLARGIRVQDMASHAAVSARTLMRRFKAHTGEGPLAYLQKLRLETGKALLANTNYRLTQILERIGYHDESAFRRLFKRATNLSPREYRRRFGGKAG
ncbi:MAG: GlxA family transcriptional regulator [Gammaproteobacteria bacterium]